MGRISKIAKVILVIATIYIVTLDSFASTYTNSNNIAASDTTSNNNQKVYDEQWVRSFKKPDEGLMKALINYYKLPENISRVFFCLALTDTKRFKDDKLMEAQNLYCLCDETNLGEYFRYKHWSESVTDILSIYYQELREDIYNIADLLDCITSHHNRDKVVEMSKYHEMYFGKPLPIRSIEENEMRKKKGGLPW